MADKRAHENGIVAWHALAACVCHKLPAFEKLLKDSGNELSQIAYVGDDLPDLPIMQRVGFAIAVQNAHGFVKQHCDWVTTASGGHGAIREVTDFILHAQGMLDNKHNTYLE